MLLLERSARLCQPFNCLPILRWSFVLGIVKKGIAFPMVLCARSPTPDLLRPSHIFFFNLRSSLIPHFALAGSGLSQNLRTGSTALTHEIAKHDILRGRKSPVLFRGIADDTEVRLRIAIRKVWFVRKWLLPPHSQARGLPPGLGGSSPTLFSGGGSSSSARPKPRNLETAETPARTAGISRVAVAPMDCKTENTPPVAPP